MKASKENLTEGGVNVPVTAKVEVPMSIHVDPSSCIPEDQSPNECVEQQVTERRGEVARGVADGVPESQISSSIKPTDLMERLSEVEA